MLKFNFCCAIILLKVKHEKILTIILDGFGIRDEEKGNAIKQAHMNNFNELWSKYPHALLGASEEAVGLAPGQAGNSEVGHMTIGAGRLLKQNEVLVNDFCYPQIWKIKMSLN